MVLPGASLFPSSLLPLYIFEERYRSMLSWSLERGRVFCIAQMKPGGAGAHEEGFHAVAGLGLIRACVENEDGTSQLVLQGLARVRLANFVQHRPFRIAQISELRSSVENEIEAGALGIKVLELCRSLKGQKRRPPRPPQQSDLANHQPRNDLRLCGAGVRGRPGDAPEIPRRAFRVQQAAQAHRLPPGRIALSLIRCAGSTAPAAPFPSALSIPSSVNRRLCSSSR